MAKPKTCVFAKARRTELIIGEITDIYLDEACQQEDGFGDIEAIDTVAVSGLDSYHVTERLARLAYAKK